ncbi:hypothetical protein STEG23_004381 [Scotinomys teguina]
MCSVNSKLPATSMILTREQCTGLYKLQMAGIFLEEDGSMILDQIPRVQSGSYLSTGWFTFILAMDACYSIHVYGMINDTYCNCEDDGVGKDDCDHHGPEHPLTWMVTASNLNLVFGEGFLFILFFLVVQPCLLHFTTYLIRRTEWNSLDGHPQCLMLPGVNEGHEGDLF